MVDGEALLHPSASTVSQACRQRRILDQLGDRHRHGSNVSLIYEEAALAFEHHFRDTGMTGRNHGKSTELGLHHSHRTAFAVAIGGHQGMLNKAADLAHQRRHLLLPAQPQQMHPVLQLEGLH